MILFFLFIFSCHLNACGYSVLSVRVFVFLLIFRIRFLFALKCILYLRLIKRSDKKSLFYALYLYIYNIYILLFQNNILTVLLQCLNSFSKL